MIGFPRRAPAADKRPPTRRVSTAGTMVVGKTTYAVSLFWQTATDLSLVKLARQRAAEDQSDLVCVRDTVARQYALGDTTKGHRAGLPSAAALLADKLEGSWHGIFQTKKGFWYIQVLKDAIQPDGDYLYLDEQEALARLQRDLAEGTWERTYAPAHFNIPDALAIPLADLLTGQTKSKLKAANANAAIVRTIAGALVTVIAAATIVLIYNTLMGDDDAAKKTVIKQTQRVLPPPPPPPTPPWRKEVSPHQWLAACNDGLDKVIATIPGWTLVNASCTTAGVSAKYRRQNGSIDWLLHALETLSPEVRGGVVGQGNEAILSTRFQFPGAQLAVGEPTLAAPAAQRSIWTVFQRVGETPVASETSIAGAPIPATIPGQPPAPAPSWKALKLEIKSRHPPPTVGDLVELPGLVINAVDWNGETRHWTYAGLLYLKPEAEQ